MATERRIRVAVIGEGATVAALVGDLASLDRFDLAVDPGDAGTDVVLLVHGDNLDPREALATLREHSLLPVILVTDAPSTELVHWALDGGIADVLPLPASPEGLHFAIEKAARDASRRAESGRGRVVTVFSPKGGSGKSVVSTNLAVASALHTTSRTLLIDLDLQFGDAAIMLGLAPANTLHELIGTPATLDAVVRIQEISTRQNIPKRFLEQILNDLQSAGNAGEYYTPRAVTAFSWNSCSSLSSS